MGVQLVDLHPSELARIELDAQLIEAIETCRDLPVRSRRRQERLIGQLLRREDHEVIRAALAVAGRARRDEARSEKENDAWRERLIGGGDDDLQALCEAYPAADRQRLRKLIRSARNEAISNKTKRSRRDLLRAIRTLRLEPDETNA